MSPADVERVTNEIKKALGRASHHQRVGDTERMKGEAETAAEHFYTLYKQAGDHYRRIYEAFRIEMESLGYEQDPATGATPESRWKWKDKVEKADISGLNPGGQPHFSGARPSTENDHEEGQATKGRSYGGEAGDQSRDYPRKRPVGHKGPWPPPMRPISQPLTKDDTGDASAQQVGASNPSYFEFDSQGEAKEVFDIACRVVNPLVWSTDQSTGKVRLYFSSEDEALIQGVLTTAGYEE